MDICIGMSLGVSLQIPERYMTYEHLKCSILNVRRSKLIYSIVRNLIKIKTYQ